MLEYGAGDEPKNDILGRNKIENLVRANFKINEKNIHLIAWMPAISIYFKDPDGHELEFITKLPGDPRPKLHVLTYDQWLKHSEYSQT